MISTLLSCVSSFLDITMKLRQLHKTGADKEILADIGQSITELHDKVSNYHFAVVKKGKTTKPKPTHLRRPTLAEVKGGSDDSSKDIHAETD